MKLERYKYEEFTGHRDCIYALGKSSEPRGFITAGLDGMIVEWNTDHPNAGRQKAWIQEPVYTLLNPADNLILAGTSKGNLYAMKTGDKPRAFEIHQGGVFGIFRDRHDRIVSIGGDGRIIQLKIVDFQVVKSIKLCNSSLRCMIEDETDVWVGASDRNIYGLNTDKDETEIRKFEAHDSSVFSLAWDDKNRILISGGRDAKIKVWNEEMQLIKSVDAHWFHVNDLKINPLVPIVASASMDKSVRIWKLPEMDLLLSINPLKEGSHTNSVNKLLWLDEETLISVGDDRKVLVHHFRYMDNN